MRNEEEKKDNRLGCILRQSFKYLHENIHPSSGIVGNYRMYSFSFVFYVLKIF